MLIKAARALSAPVAGVCLEKPRYQESPAACQLVYSSLSDSRGSCKPPASLPPEAKARIMMLSMLLLFASPRQAQAPLPSDCIQTSCSNRTTSPDAFLAQLPSSLASAPTRLALSPSFQA